MQKMEVLPKSLPNATVGNPYYARIKVVGGVANSNQFSIISNQKNLVLNYFLLIIEQHIFPIIILN